MNILVIRFSSLGDLVTLEPTFRAVRHFFPGAIITFLTTAVGKGLYNGSDYFDEFILHEGVVSSIRKLGRYDLILNLQCNKPSHLVRLFSSHNKHVNKSYNLYQKIFGIKVKPKTEHELLLDMGVSSRQSENYWADPHSRIISLPVNAVASETFTKSAKRVAISTGSSERWQSKQWGLERYIELIEGLIERHCDVSLVGSSLEMKDAKEICRRIPQVKNLVGQTNLSELKVFLDGMDLYIGNDSGPSHIAAGVACPTITIFGPTDVVHCVKNLNYESRHICVKPGDTVKCHPCYLGDCPTKHECMQDIAPAVVLDYALRQLTTG